jgi:hypothetical protein
MTSYRIRRLLDDRDLEERAAPDEEVAGFWKKALRAYHDSRVPGLSPQGSFNAAYEAALDAATALIREAGYRVQSRTRHHWAAFYAVQGLGDSALEDLGADLDAARGDRHENVYQPEDDEAVAARRRDDLHRVLQALLPATHRRLVERRSSLAAVLEPPALPDRGVQGGKS